MDKKDKKDLDKVTKKVRKAAEEGNIVFSPQTVISMFPVTVNDLLQVIGHPEAWISDRSSLNNFGDPEEFIEDINKYFGCDITEVANEDFKVLVLFLVKNRKNR